MKITVGAVNFFSMEMLKVTIDSGPDEKTGFTYKQLNDLAWKSAREAVDAHPAGDWHMWGVPSATEDEECPE